MSKKKKKKSTKRIDWKVLLINGLVDITTSVLAGIIIHLMFS